MSEIDHEYTNGVICPYCGEEQDDLWDIDGAYTEDETRMDCQDCGKEFASYCHVSHSFTTYEVDKEAEEREKAKRYAAAEERRLKKFNEASEWLPGTRVRVNDDRLGAPHNGRTGVISNKERDHHGFVNVDLDFVKGPHHIRSFEGFFSAENLERIP